MWLRWGQTTSEFRTFVVKALGKCPLGSPTKRWYDTINTNPKEMDDVIKCTGDPLKFSYRDVRSLSHEH